MRILVAANVVPYPPRGGTELRIFHLLTRIAERHDVILCCHARSEADELHAHELSAFGIRTFTGRPASNIHPSAICAAALHLMNGRPPELALYYSRELDSTIRRLLRSEAFDVFQIEEIILTPYLNALRAIEVPAVTMGQAACRHPQRVVVFHNVHTVQEARAATLERHFGMRAWRRLNSMRMRAYEPSIMGTVDRCIAVTEHDRRLLADMHPGARIDVVPNGVDTVSLQPLRHPEGPPAIVFVGHMGYKPCEDGAIWLIGEILPRVLKQAADATVWIAGKCPGTQLKALAGERVFVTGEIPDVTPYYERSMIAVAPLRAGSGSRLKILEAMALGRPVVSTTIGAEGLEVRHGTHLLIADDATSFAAAIGTLIHNPGLRESLVKTARLFVQERYDWDSVAKKQLSIYDEMCVEGSNTLTCT